MLPVRRTNWIPGIFNDFFGNEWIEKRASSAAPAVNIIENENEYKVEVAAPGLTKDDFNIEIHDDNNLIVSMEKKTENREDNKESKYLRRKFSHVSFRQSMILPDNINKDNIEAKVENGILNITIPKQKLEEKIEKTKKIDIK